MYNTLGITLIHFVNRACLDVALMERFYSVGRRRLCVRPLIGEWLNSSQLIYVCWRTDGESWQLYLCLQRYVSS